MDNEIVQAVMERSKGLCEICHSSFMAEKHHIIKGRGKRKVHETVESIIVLCWEHHYGTYGVHGREGKELDLRLKIQLQDKYFRQGYSEDEIRKLMGGKLYG